MADMTGRVAPEPTGTAVARILAGGLPARVECASWVINERFIAYFDRCDRIPALGEQVTAIHPQYGERGATVVGIDEDHRLIRLEVTPDQPAGAAPTV